MLLEANDQQQSNEQSHTLSEQKLRKPASEADNALAAESSNPNQINRTNALISCQHSAEQNGTKERSI